MREVVEDRLWIGDARDARDIRAVTDLGVEGVVDLAIEESPITFPREITYGRFPLLDGKGNSSVLLNIAVDTIARLVGGQVPTLVACSGGMSRSPAILAAAFSKIESIQFNEALERIVRSGPCDLTPGLWHDLSSIYK